MVPTSAAPRGPPASTTRAASFDAPHLTHLEEIQALRELHGEGRVASRYRRVNVAVVGGVGRPHEPVPVQARESLLALLRLDPLVLHPGITPHFDQPQEALPLFFRLGDY